MKKIKSPSVAGKFYTDNKEELIYQLNEFEKNLMSEYQIKTRAVIVPHAGYFYSGQLALEGIKYLDNPKNIFIFAPSHQEAYNGIALSDYDGWATPLGETAIEVCINEELHKKFSAEYFDRAFEFEHSAEIQVPIIQHFFPNAKIVPVLIGRENPEKIAEIIDYYWQNKENSFVISSDLSHFLSDDDARKIDRITAQMIEQKDVEAFNHGQACGSIGIQGLVQFAAKYNFTPIRVGLINSSDTSGDKSKVVGYGSWLLYEGEKNDLIKQYFSNTVLEICKTSIEAGLKHETPLIPYYPQVFDQLGASFVTLQKNNDLRGCIGSILARRPLIEDLTDNAQNAAFYDPRFEPLSYEEFRQIEIHVSLLSAPVKMTFADENDLLNQIQPFTDGIIIKDGYHQAVYLPSVWEQLSDKKEFLNSLKIKAGLPPNHFSKNFEAYSFYCECIK